MVQNIITFLPHIIFGVPFAVIFGLFISGAFTLLFTSNDERGKDTIIRALTYFLILLAVFLVFIIVSFLIRAGYILEPREEETGLPQSPIGAFPPPTEFILIEGYSFSGPFPLREADVLEERVGYIVLCEKEEGYDIIDIDVNSRGKPISGNKRYACWRENCNDLKLAVYWFPETMSGDVRGTVREITEKLDNIICQEK